MPEHIKQKLAWPLAWRLERSPNFSEVLEGLSITMYPSSPIYKFVIAYTPPSCTTQINPVRNHTVSRRIDNIKINQRITPPLFQPGVSVVTHTFPTRGIVAFLRRPPLHLRAAKIECTIHTLGSECTGRSPDDDRNCRSACRKPTSQTAMQPLLSRPMEITFFVQSLKRTTAARLSP